MISVQSLLGLMKLVEMWRPQPLWVYLICWIFIFAAGHVLAAMVPKMEPKALSGFLIVEFLLTFLLLSAVVQMIFYDYRSTLARRAYDILLILAVLNKCCWPQISQAVQWCYGLINKAAQKRMMGTLVTAFGMLLMALIIFVPNYERVVARIFIGEQFHHYDIFVMSSGWAAYKGHIMDVNQISQYGVGMPYVFAMLNRWMGGFSHEHVFLIIMTGTMFYYVLMFWLARQWFKSASLTLAVMLCGVRLQMFHPGGYPFMLTYPSATVIRYFFDIFILAAIYLHLQSKSGRWLWVAGALSGFSVFYMDSTGTFLLAAYWAYLVCLLIMPYTRALLYKAPRDAGIILGYFLWPLAVAFVFFYKTVGNHLFTAHFWHNFSETVEYFLSGIGTYPFFDNFKYHNFLAGLMGIIIPAVWVFTILFAGAMCYFKRLSRRNIFIIVVCVYGLGVNHYYVARAVLTSYYVTALPFAIVCGWWAKILIWGWSRQVRQNTLLVLVLVSLYALLTNHNFMAYPNIFNWSRNPMVDPLTAQPLPADLSPYFNHLFRNDPEGLKLAVNSQGSTDEQIFSEKDFATDNDLVAYYQREFDFSKDAALIRSLTEPDKPVALISSFETKILMQADRPPFFYYFPLISSRPKHMRTMPLNFLHTSAERFNAKAIEQLRDENPKYVFLEKIFLNDFPKAYADKPENIIPIVAYVRARYALVQMGEYIAVMKHK